MSKKEPVNKETFATVQKYFVQILPYVVAFSLFVIVFWITVQPIRNNQGMWYSDDDVQVVRTQEMVKELRRGQFPVRMLHDLGNGGGYPLFNYYSPLAYYLTASLVFLGQLPLNAVKIVFQLTFLLAGFGMFFYIRFLTKSKLLLPLFAAIILITSPYFLYDVFTRGALAETLGFALVPLVLLGLELLLVSEKKWISIVLFSTSFALLMYAHAIPAMGILIFLVIRLLVAFWYKENIDFFRLTVGLVMAFCLAASFIFPLLAERTFVAYSQSNFVNTGFQSGFTPLKEVLGLFTLPKEFLPKSLGSAMLALLLFSLIVVLSHLNKIPSNSKLQLAFLFFSLLISVIFIHFISYPLWDQISFLKIMQFPYRFFLFATVFAIAFSMLGLSLLKSKALIIGSAVIYFFLVFLLQQQYFFPKGYYFASEFNAEDDCVTTSWQQELLPVAVRDCLPKNTTELISPDSQVKGIPLPNTKANTYNIKTNGAAGTVVLNKYYFPGWHMTVNGHPVSVFSTGESGLLTAVVPEGEHVVEITFKDTVIRTISNYVTLLSLIFSTILSIIIFIKIFNKTYFKNTKAIEKYTK